jgi:hypothetical protein
MELFPRLAGGPRPPMLVMPGLIVALWTVSYMQAWFRIPLLLLRAAAGELEPPGAEALPATHEGPVT